MYELTAKLFEVDSDTNSVMSSANIREEQYVPRNCGMSLMRRMNSFPQVCCFFITVDLLVLPQSQKNIFLWKCAVHSHNYGQK